jgi:tRNA dimethylallyltransferase
MWQAGFVTEVRELMAEGLAEGPTASRALGYRQVIAALSAGEAPDRAQADTVVATRRFARRQQSWFSRDPRIEWIDGSADLSVQCAAVLRLAGAA